MAYLAEGNDDEALADLNTALALSEAFANASNYRAYGDDYRQRGDTNTSIARGIIPNIYYHRGLVYNRKEDYHRAVSDFSKAIQLAPVFYYAFVGRGLTYMEIGDQPAAIVNFNRAIELNPKYAAAYQNRGAALNAMGREAEANVDFAKAKELSAH